MVVAVAGAGPCPRSVAGKTKRTQEISRIQYVSFLQLFGWWLPVPLHEREAEAKAIPAQIGWRSSQSITWAALASGGNTG
jgi:hypothetical protein